MILENYGAPAKDPDKLNDQWVQEVVRDKGHISSSSVVMTSTPSWREIVTEGGELNLIG